MSNAADLGEGSVQEATPAAQSWQRVPPPESRFLFVDVSAMRAKQLRRGAVPRMSSEADPTAASHETPHKFERVAMKEVREGLIQYLLPGTDSAGKEEGA